MQSTFRAAGMLAVVLVMAACGENPRQLTARGDAVKRAVLAHRECGARNLQGLLDRRAEGTQRALAEAAERQCARERDGLRAAIEEENAQEARRYSHSRTVVEGFADSAVRQQQDEVVRVLVIAQTLASRPALASSGPAQ